VSVTSTETPARPSFGPGHALIVICPSSGVASTAFIQEVDEDLLKPARISGHIGQGLGMLVVMAMPALAHHVLHNGSSRPISSPTGTR
jgi:hypothetical protein